MSKYDAFDHLCRSINLAGDKERLMAMFTAYLDESFGKADAYSVAGYVATVEQWAEFVREWREFCSDEGIEYLHKRELEHCQGQFKKWQALPKDEQDKNKMRVNKRACNIILRRANAGFGASVKKSEWLALDKDRIADVLGTSFYAAGVKSCMQLIVGWAQDFNKHGEIDYVFDSGAEGAPELTRLLQAIESTTELRDFYRLGSWSFARKKPQNGKLNNSVIPLQAADMLAYETYRHMDNKVLDGGKLNKQGEVFPMRGALKCLLQHDQPAYANLHIQNKPTPYYIVYLHDENVKELIEQLGELNISPPILDS